MLPLSSLFLLYLTPTKRTKARGAVADSFRARALHAKKTNKPDAFKGLNMTTSLSPPCVPAPRSTNKGLENSVPGQSHPCLRLRQRLRGKLRLGAGWEVSYGALLGPGCKEGFGIARAQLTAFTVVLWPFIQGTTACSCDGRHIRWPLRCPLGFVFLRPGRQRGFPRHLLGASEQQWAQSNK